MEFKELKNIIENPGYPKKNFDAPLNLTYGDSFRLVSAMYNQDIYLNSLSSIEDLYKKIEDYNLDPDIFNQPYYLVVSLEDFNDNTIDILNKLDRNIVVHLATHGIIEEKEREFLSKLKSENIYLYNNNWISQESMKFVISRFKSDDDDSPVLVIDKIDSNTAKLIQDCVLKYPKLRCRIEIKDISSINNLNEIINFIPEEEISIYLDDDIFNDKNPNNIRKTILQQDFSLNLNIPEGKKIQVNYNGLKYQSFEEVFNLERYLEIVKSHIPSKASDLDIVTYVTLFEANYFRYDYDEYERIKDYANNRGNNVDIINLTEFITSRKGVCRDYAAFTKYLLNSLNVECDVVETDTEFYYDHSMDEGHAFNIVKINEKQHFIDNTWIAETLQTGQVQSLDESPFFLSSGDDFEHDDYKVILDRYNCETIDRESVVQSTNRVLNWNKNYFIHPQALKDLFRKHIMKKQMTVESQIEDAIPSRRR